MKPLVLLLLCCSLSYAQSQVYLHELDLTTIDLGWGSVQQNKSVDGNPLRVGGKVFERGVGTHAVSRMMVNLAGAGIRFTAFVGVDDEAGKRGSIEFVVLGDKKILWRSGVINGGDSAKAVSVDLAGINVLALLATNGGDNIDYDHADWCEAKIELAEMRTKEQLRLDATGVSSEPYILTPKPSSKPRINGPQIFGVRPGSPFRYTIPTTGARPIEFSADNLPNGLRLDKQTGQISGTLQQRSTYELTLRAKNSFGSAMGKFKIVCGDAIALTPPLGWNSWNCWAGAVDDVKVRSSVKAMVEKSLVNHGWTYINIDDTWQGKRGGKFNAIQPNQKFPSMKALADYVHGLGLKIGIYSTPWITSYALYNGGSSDNEQGLWSRDSMANSKSWRHGKISFEAKDAKQWAEWGMDYLKYDWNPNNVEAVSKMKNALDASGRDIVYSLSNSAPFEHAADWTQLANAWRTTGDIVDTWSSMSGIGFSQDRWRPYGGPGHWNDPDMLVVGLVGWGPSLHPTRLKPDEQYTHVSLWCLLSAPMLLGCDLARLDEFTLNLLTNDEVLEVNQDALGKQAARLKHEDGTEVWVKELEDGSKAVGLFYTGESGDDPVKAFNWDGERRRRISVRASDVGLEGKFSVRDLWRQKELGVFSEKFSADVPYHGVVLVKVSQKK